MNKSDIYFYVNKGDGLITKIELLDYNPRENKYTDMLDRYLLPEYKEVLIIINSGKPELVFLRPIKINRDLYNIKRDNIDLESFMSICSGAFKLYILNNIDEFPI